MEAFILIFICIIIAPAAATPLIPLPTHHPPQINESSMVVNKTQEPAGGEESSDVEELDDGGCVYMVTIKTSCNSPSYTNDEISTLFGDANGTEVYVPRLDDPDAGAFEQCSTNAFEILGPCSSGKICKMYLFRNGSDGWLPETVTAYDYNYPPITFNYNTYIPDDAGYGFNYCDTNI